MNESRNSRSRIPQILRDLSQSAALVSTLVSGPAWSSPGDLDPGFGDVGRLGPLEDLDGVAHALELQGDGFILGGGDYSPEYFVFDLDARNFVRRLLGDGSQDSAFFAVPLERTEILDVAVEPGTGKALAVGRMFGTRGNPFEHSPSSLVLFRLDPDGTLDPGFGDGGVVQLGAGPEQEERYTGTSVQAEPDGKVIVAGTRGDALVVARFLEDGTLDASFGTAGIYDGAGNAYSASRPRIRRTEDGGYRITVNIAEGLWLNCGVLALTAEGIVETSFGNNGIADLPHEPSRSVLCMAMEQEHDGGLVFAGQQGEGGVVIRLLGTGVVDPTFTAPAVAQEMSFVSALGVQPDDSLLVAGQVYGVSGAIVAHLQADGLVDATFGDSGTTWIDLPSTGDAPTTVNDIATLEGGAALLAGGTGWQFPRHPFVARLLGADGGGSPGVVGLKAAVTASEVDGVAVVEVRRMGGRAGDVSVTYDTANRPGDYAASEGSDYTAVSGPLSWSDGDQDVRRIEVPIETNTGAVEDWEYFSVNIHDVQGGAGLGTRTVDVAITPDGDPNGQLSISADQSAEGDSVAHIYIFRNYYYEGQVSVTMTPVPGTATAGQDFDGAAVTVTWPDGDGSTRTVDIPLIDDDGDEGHETFMVELSNATGGALIGNPSSASIDIADDDSPSPPPEPPPGGGSSGGGGGSTGMLSLLILGALRLFRRRHPPS